MKQIKFLDIFILLIFSYLAGLLLWGMVFQPDLILFITNNQITIHGKFMLPSLGLIFLIIFGIYIWNYSQNSLPFRLRDRKIILYLIFILIIGIVWPSLKFLEIFNLPFFNFEWVSQTKNPIGIFALSLSLAIFIYQFFISKSQLWEKISKISEWPIYILIIFSALIYAIHSIVKYNHFQMPALDFGLADQAIWQYSHFIFPAASSLKHVSNILADHFHPIWILVSSLYWIWQDPRILVIFDAFIVSLGALPIFWLSRKELKNNFFALILSFGYLFFIGVQLALDFPFRGDTLATTFLAFAVWFLYQKKWLKYFLMVILILISKESFGLYILFLGIFAILWKKEWKVGLITAFLGAVWFILIVNYLIPHLRHGPYHVFTYHQLGNNFKETLKTILINPLYTLKIFFSPAIKINTILTLFGAVGFLTFLAPFFLILSIPMLAERFLSADPSFWILLFHYSVTISPVIFIGAIFGLKNLSRKIPLKIILPITAIIILFSTFLISCAWRAPLIHLFRSSFWKMPSQAKTIQKALRFIPKDAAVSAQDSIVSHLSQREKIYLFPDDISNSDFVLLDIKSGFYPVQDKKYYAFLINGLLNSKDFGILMSDGSTILFQKGIDDKTQPSIEIRNFLDENK